MFHPESLARCAADLLGLEVRTLVMPTADREQAGTKKVRAGRIREHECTDWITGYHLTSRYVQPGERERERDREGG